MAGTPQTHEPHILQVAADWWTRLREPQAADASLQQWLDWTAQDERHLAAFECVSAFGARLGQLDAAARERLMAEFAPTAVAPGRWRPLAAAAAVLAVVLGVGVLLWGRQGGGVAPVVYASATGQNRDIVLADGSQVALGGASRISVRFDRRRRQVALESGEAYFQVVHDAQRPFEVAAGSVTVRDIGTAFDVRRGAGEVAVAVTRGKVRVSDVDSGVDAQAGQRVDWDTAGSALRLGTTTAEQATAWRDHRLAFVDEPLKVVIASINRYSARPVRLDGAEAGALRFTGSVRTDAIDGWLRALPDVLPLKVSEGAQATTLSLDATPAKR
jgi:transmembrane sensor